MSGVGAKFTVRRYSPARYTNAHLEDDAAMTPQGKEQVYDTWRDVCEAADTIVGENALQVGVEPTEPVVIKHGDDIILIFMKLVI